MNRYWDTFMQFAADQKNGNVISGQDVETFVRIYELITSLVFEKIEINHLCNA